MSFLTTLALLGVLLVGAPVAAHLLRRRRAAEVELPTARWLAATPPTARRRSALEDRLLLSVRSLAVLLLAVLGATPFVSCSRLSLLRKNGASVAMVLVVDDSLSMRARLPGGETRFARAQRAARELVDGAQPGDAFAIVLAGGEARVALTTTTDLRAASEAIGELAPSDRATDLRAALSLSRDLLRGAAQPDKRVVVLSDLADGDAASAPLDADAELTLWYPLEELRADPATADCAVLEGEREGEWVRAEIACTGARDKPLVIGLFAPGAVGKPLLTSELAPSETRVTFKLAADAPADLDVRLIDAGDAIAEDDAAPVAPASAQVAIGVVSDAAATRVETGGPPAVEQALTALELGGAVKTLAAPPEHAEELARLSGLILDDVPGLTPEERRTTVDWIEGGGHVLVSLGRRAAAAPLGAGFGAIVPGVTRFAPGGAQSARVADCAALGESAASLTDLKLAGHTVLDEEALRGATVLCALDDGTPLLVSRPLGRGLVIVSTVAFNLDDGDFALRPAFLALLDEFVRRAESRGGASHVDAGQAFTFPGATSVAGDLLALGETTPQRVEVLSGTGARRAQAPRIGRYAFEVDGARETRFAHAPAREISFAPHALAARAVDPSLGGPARKLDASPYVAFALLGLLLVELALRLLLPSSAATHTVSAQPEPPR